MNEGTSLSRAVRNLPLDNPLLDEDAAFTEFIGSLILDHTTLSPETLKTIHKLYPANDSSLGGPFNTGDSLFDRASAWYGDEMYLAPRRLFFQTAAKNPRHVLFAYFFKEFVKGSDPVFGGKNYMSLTSGSALTGK